MAEQEDLLQALKFRYNGAPESAVISVHTFDSRFLTRTFRVSELERIAEEYAGRQGDTWSRISLLPGDVRLPEGSRGTERDTFGTFVLHVDVDPQPMDNEPLESWQARKLEELRNFRPKPSAIEFSGRGYYAFWRLISFEQDWQRVKRINKWLALQLGGDDCYDVARILRLPTTKNTKPDAGIAQVVECDWDLTYHIDEFPEASLTSMEGTLQEMELQPEPLALDFEQRCRQSPQLWMRITTEAGAREAGAKLRANGADVDRSRNDFAIAGTLLRMGISPGQVYTVLTHPTWFSGEKWREHGFRDSYVLYTIHQATRLVTDSPSTNLTVLGARLMKDFQWLCFAGDWFRYEEDRGVFVSAGEFLPLAVQALTGQKWRPDIESGVAKFMAPHVSQDALPSYDLINVTNGMLDPLTGRLEPHSPGYRSITQINAAWDPSVDTAAVDAFVNAILQPDSVEDWWRFVGYCLYTKTPLPYRCLLGIVGPRRTGKTTLLSAQTLFLGNENCSSIPLSDLTGKGNQFTLAGLLGKLLNVDSDAPYEHGIGTINTLKKLGSNDPVQIEKKYLPTFTTYLSVKLAFAMNNFPTVGVTDEAFYDRWVLLQVRKDRPAFTNSNTATKINAHLALLSVAANRSAWLLRGVQGLRQLHQHGGFIETQASRRAKDEFRAVSDTVYAFWKLCSKESNDEQRKPVGSAYNTYSYWCNENGQPPVSLRRFILRSVELAGEGLLPGMVITNGATRGYYGRLITYGMGVTIQGLGNAATADG